MKSFKEYIAEGAMDGGNAGEYNLAKAEQKVQVDARAKGKDAKEIAGKCVQILAQKTGKRWTYIGEASRHGYTEGKQGVVLKNPGRLKGWKEIKKSYNMRPYEKELADALGAKETNGIPMNYELGKITFQLAFIGKSRDLEIFVP